MTAELIGQLREQAKARPRIYSWENETHQLEWKAASALAAQAQEIERKDGLLDDCHRALIHMEDCERTAIKRAETAEARVREVETDNALLKANWMKGEWIKSERDAINECAAQIAEQWKAPIGPDIAAAIRALRLNPAG